MAASILICEFWHVYYVDTWNHLFLLADDYLASLVNVYIRHDFLKRCKV